MKCDESGTDLTFHLLWDFAILKYYEDCMLCVGMINRSLSYRRSDWLRSRSQRETCNAEMSEHTGLEQCGMEWSALKTNGRDETGLGWICLEWTWECENELIVAPSRSLSLSLRSWQAPESGGRWNATKIIIASNLIEINITWNVTEIIVGPLAKKFFQKSEMCGRFQISLT